MIRRRIAAGGAVAAAAAALVLLPAGAASAHPLGNFTVNRYDGLVAAPGKLRIDHVEDLAEIPAAQAKPLVDADRDGKMTGGELTAWAKTRCEAAVRGGRLTVDGKPERPVTEAATAAVRPGQAGLPTLRVECRLTAKLPRGERTSVAYTPADIGTGPGWREITARGDLMTLSGSDVPEKSLSRRLTSYPRDLLSSPDNIRSATLRAAPGGPALADDGTGTQTPAAGILPRGTDRWTQALTGLVARHHLTFGFAILALGTALILGAMHALAPGHGKTMMAAAAAAGGRRSRRDMFALGASVTATHTMGVFALGALVTAGSAAAPSVIAWLGIASGVLVAFAGAVLLRRAWRLRDQPHSHGHGHDHGHDHGHSHGHPHPHPNPHGPTAEPHDRVLVSASATSTASAHSTKTVLTSEQPEPETNAPAPHDHPHPHTHPHPRPHAHSHSAGPTLRGTILLGFAGGLVPSPSAVVVLVGAAALGQAWFGFLLVLAYGAGLALTLTAAGFLVVRVGERVARRTRERAQGRLLTLAHRLAPLSTAAVVLALGCGLVLRGVATTLG